MAELRVIGAVYADGSGETCVVERLLGVVVGMKPVTALDEIQHAHFGQWKTRHIGHLSVRIDRVTKVGRVHILVSYTHAERGGAYLRSIMRCKGG